MAEQKQVVALEIGAQSVVMGVFVSTGKQGMVLSRYARKDIVLDPVEEGLRIEYVSAAIGELVSELKLKNNSVRSVVSGQQVFIRFIKLPPIESDDLRRLVGFEAQQHIPFPMEEIVWDFQLLPDRGEAEREAILVAIKTETLDALNDQITAHGIHNTGVGCSITSLYNAFRYNYPDETAPVMILDIGAKTTDIIYTEPERFYTRSVTVGGAFITNAIARDLHCSFKDAEEIKVQQGMVSMANGHTEGMSPVEAQVSTTVRNAMTRLASEIQRTTNHYRAQFKGNAPTKAYICGGGALLRYTREFLEETIGIPVEHMNPLANIPVSKHVDQNSLATDSVILGGIVGAAVEACSDAEISIDLVPTSVGKDRAEKQLLPKIAIAGSIAVLGAAIFAGAAYMKKTETAAARIKVAAAVKKAERIGSEISAAENKITDCERTIQKYTNLYNMRFAYMDILQDMTQNTASPNFWISSFVPLVNFNPLDTDLASKNGIKEAALVRDRFDSGNDTALQTVKQDKNNKNSKIAQNVTAICIEGYVLDKSITGSTTGDTVRDNIRQTLGSQSPESPFTFVVKKNTNDKKGVMLEDRMYLSIEDSTQAKLPPYVEKFTMIIPLKHPIPVPAK
ncbi:type IV pilus assembly protein PilM [Akkermansia glycaniphila]|uniref:Amuc_1101 family PilM-like pilus complex protein n=1 Tax=Akkermansia glycaniphila TaxID=1679444 RepID=UPI001C009E26|nr:type IV pilus assembly protein PilM [Akkermansia glycaniphila]MBT9450489.1 type IV pilus assembly protein PilM [Akkermansia glycaniphila]